MTAIEITGLAKTYKERPAVKNLNLSIGQGEFFRRKMSSDRA